MLKYVKNSIAGKLAQEQLRRVSQRSESLLMSCFQTLGHASCLSLATWHQKERGLAPRRTRDCFHLCNVSSFIVNNVHNLEVYRYRTAYSTQVIVWTRVNFCRVVPLVPTIDIFEIPQSVYCWLSIRDGFLQTDRNKTSRFISSSSILRRYSTHVF